MPKAEPSFNGGIPLESGTYALFEDNLFVHVVKNINLCVLPPPIVRDDKS